MSAFTIYGDRRSGNCLKVLYVSDLLKLDYAWQDVDIMAGETRQAAFLALNPFGQIPLIRLADGKVLTQSNVIMLYLAEGSALIPASTWERAQMLEWLFWEQYSHEPVIAVRRFQKLYLNKPDAEIEPSLMPRGIRVLEHLERGLTGRDWLVGTTMSLADIALYAYTSRAHEGGFDLAPYAAICGWIARVSAVLEPKD